MCRYFLKFIFNLLAEKTNSADFNVGNICVDTYVKYNKTSDNDGKD